MGTPVAAHSQGGATERNLKTGALLPGRRCQEFGLGSASFGWHSPYPGQLLVSTWGPVDCQDRSCVATLRRRWAGLLGTPGRILSLFSAAAGADLPARTNSEYSREAAATVLRSTNGQWADLLGAKAATTADIHRAATAAGDICPAATAAANICRAATAAASIYTAAIATSRNCIYTSC